MTKKKQGDFIIDIGANVGDSLTAMWNHTNDRFICIEPVEEFFNLLSDNVRNLEKPDRVHIERAFITDNMEGAYSAKVNPSGTASMERLKDEKPKTPSKTVDFLLKERNVKSESIDLLKIDTDGFDGDCLISARSLLKNGNALLYWENCYRTYMQYEKYLEAYDLLNHEGYSTFFIFDNYGNYLCKGGVDIMRSVAEYMQRVRVGWGGTTFTYCDVLACKLEDVELCEEGIAEYLQKFPLCRIRM